MNDVILVASSDMAFSSAIEVIAKREMLECIFLSYGEHLVDVMRRTNPILLIADFSSQESEWVLKHVSEIKQERNNFPVIGFVSGSFESDAIRIQKAGCDYVLPQNQLEKRLPAIFEKYLH